MGAADESQPGLDGQGRSEHQQRRRPGHGGVAERDGRLRHVLAEEHHPWFEHPAAVGAGSHPKPAGVLQIHVTVGRRRHLDRRAEAGIESHQAGMQVGPRGDLVAGETDDLVDPAVQVGHPAGPGVGVQPVDVLRDRPVDQPGAFQGRHRAVALVRHGPGHPLPAQVAASPVSLACLGAGAELLVGHGGAGNRTGATVVRDPGVGRQAGAGQHHAPAAGDHGGQVGDRRGGVQPGADMRRRSWSRRPRYRAGTRCEPRSGRAGGSDQASAVSRSNATAEYAAMIGFVEA